MVGVPLSEGGSGGGGGGGGGAAISELVSRQRP